MGARRKRVKLCAFSGILAVTACSSAPTTTSVSAQAQGVVKSLRTNGVRAAVIQKHIDLPPRRRTVLTARAAVHSNVRALVGGQIRCTKNHRRLVSPYTTTNSNATGKPVNLLTRWLVPSNVTGRLECRYYVYSATSRGDDSTVSVSRENRPILLSASFLSARAWPIEARTLQAPAGVPLIAKTVDVPPGAQSVTALASVQLSTGRSIRPHPVNRSIGTIEVHATQSGQGCPRAAESLPYDISATTHHQKVDGGVAFGLKLAGDCGRRVTVAVGVRLRPSNALVVEGQTYSAVILAFS